MTTAYDKLVGYDGLDEFKRMAQAGAARTAKNLEGSGYKDIPESRGESAYLMEHKDHILAHVDEGLGTKNRALEQIMWESGNMAEFSNRAGDIAQDTIAMTLNDMATSGARPLSVSCHVSVASTQWFNDKSKSFVDGWVRACNAAGATWGPGETATLRDIVKEGTAVLGCSAVGIIKPKCHRIRGTAKITNVIILLPGSGIHANGLTMAREVAQELPEKYLTKLSDGRTYIDALLDPTPLYGPAVQKLLDANVPINYAINITGHGWRKFMRLPQKLQYRFSEVPEVQPVFKKIQEHRQLSNKEMYGTFNMGAGFAFILPLKMVPTAVTVLEEAGYKPFCGGHVEKSRDARKRVVIDPYHWDEPVVFEEEDLNIR